MRNSVLFLFAIGLIACKKDVKEFKTSSSINVINAAIDIASIKFNPGVKGFSFSRATDLVNYGTSRIYLTELGARSLVAVSGIDTNKVLFNGNYTMDPGFYTMYITGQSSKVDTIFKKELDFPFIKTDVTIPLNENNVTNVRFVNLSPNSPILKINVKNNSANEVDNLAYKDISGWKSYDNKAAGTTSYVFEIRNAATNSLLLTYTFSATSTNKFKNVALIIRGLSGITTGTNAFGIFPSNYF